MQTYREWFNSQTELNEMATDRKKAESIISSLSEEIFSHLVKILYWKDEINYNKHCNDIDTWLNKVDRIEIKPKSSRLKQVDYYNWLYSDMHSSERQLQKTIRFLSKDYGKLQRTSLSDDELYSKLKNIYIELCSDLHKDIYSSIIKYLD